VADDELPDPAQSFYRRRSRREGLARSWWEISAEKYGQTLTRIRLPLTAVATLALLEFFGAVSSGGGVFVFMVIAWWLGPFMIYLFFINSRIGSLVFGATLALATGAELVWVLDVMERSSTGGLGFLTLPVFTYPAIVFAILFDRFLVWREDEKRPFSQLFLAIGSAVVALGTTLVLWNASEKIQSGLGIVVSDSGATVALADSLKEAVDIAVDELGFVWPGTTIQDETASGGTITVERRWLGLLEAQASVVPRDGRFAIESESYDFGMGNSVQLVVIALLGAIAGILIWTFGR
jgi:hypothetical protein